MKSVGKNVLAGVVGVLAGFTLCVGAAAAVEAQHEDVSVPADYDLALLETTGVQRGGSSSIPENLDPDALGPNGIRPESIRLVGSTDGAEFFIAMGTDGLLCLISSIDGPDWTISSACIGPEGFSKSGLGVQSFASGIESGTEDRTAEAYLVPDSALKARSGTAVYDELRSPVASGSDNLIVVDPYTTTEDRADLIRSLEGVPLALIPESISDAVAE